MSAVVIPFPLQRRPDLQFCNAGSFVTCTPVTPRGTDWIVANIGDDATLPLAIDFRCLEDIVLGARADGLVCHG
jgi:hypothetical protein